MQQRPKPLSLTTAMHPAREHDVTFLQMIPPTPDGTPPGFGCPAGDAVPAADASADDGCTVCTGRAGRLARPVRQHAVVLLSSGPRHGNPGTFRKSIPPGTAQAPAEYGKPHNAANYWSGHRVMTERGNESEEGSPKAAAVL
jgi:hypothetical protein